MKLDSTIVCYACGLPTLNAPRTQTGAPKYPCRPCRVAIEKRRKLRSRFPATDTPALVAVLARVLRVEAAELLDLRRNPPPAPSAEKPCSARGCPSHATAEEPICKAHLPRFAREPRRSEYGSGAERWAGARP